MPHCKADATGPASIPLCLQLVEGKQRWHNQELLHDQEAYHAITGVIAVAMLVASEQE